MRSKILIGLTSFLCLALLIAAAAAATRERIDSDFRVVVLVSGCDGLVAEGGVGTTGPGPFPYSFTHNFVAGLHQEGWGIFGEQPYAETHTHATGAGTDGAGHAFTLQGNLTLNKKGNIVVSDFWANGGEISVRRDDGAFARGEAQGADGIVTSPPLLGGRTLSVAAKECHLR